MSKAAERSKSVRRETLPVKCKENVICNFEKGCYSTMDEVVCSDVGKQPLQDNLLCDF